MMMLLMCSNRKYILYAEHFTVGWVIAGSCDETFDHYHLLAGVVAPTEEKKKTPAVLNDQFADVEYWNSSSAGFVCCHHDDVIHLICCNECCSLLGNDGKNCAAASYIYSRIVWPHTERYKGKHGGNSSRWRMYEVWTQCGRTSARSMSGMMNIKSIIIFTNIMKGPPTSI